MNQIIKSLLADFVTEQGFLAKAPVDLAFEHFAANLTIGLHIEETLDTKLCVFGEDAQPAVDGIAAIVNGRLVTKVDEIETYIALNNYLDVDFIFMQAKSSSSFDASALGDLGDWIERLFSHGATKVDNQKTKTFDQLRKYIYSKARYFKRRRPNAHIYYVTTGAVPNEDANFISREKQIKRHLEQTGDLEEVRIQLVGASSLQKRSHQLQNSISREIDFPKKVPLPDVPGVTQAFLGALPIREFIKLIQSEGGSLLSSIFYDNVRDWQGMNDVNSGIQETLKNAASRKRFVLMNNGITVIAKQVRIAGGDKLFIEDYQIVNGCQTSNVIWENRKLLENSDDVVTIKIVATAQETVIKDIIRATNSQTTITPEQLLAVTDFQKELELFFASQPEQPLYYERRSRQFVNASIERSRIITPLGLIKAYASMFLEEPHKTTRDFKSILTKVPAEIFAQSHKHDYYYVSALVLFWIQNLLPKLNSKIMIARYQVLMCVRILYDLEPPPPASSRKSIKFADGLRALFKNAKMAEQTLLPAVHIVASVKTAKRTDDARTSTFTQAVISAAKAARAVKTAGMKNSGGSNVVRPGNSAVPKVHGSGTNLKARRR